MKSKLLGGVLFVCGTSIGTGIFAVPSITAQSGFVCSLFLFTLCWVFSTLAALYLMEAHLWQKHDNANLLSMTEFFFGKYTKSVVWVVYLALLYSLMCTYLLAGSSWINQSTDFMFHVSLNQLGGMIAFVLLIGLFIFFGIRVVDRVNRFMLLGLALTYVFVLAIGLPTIKAPLLFEQVFNRGSMPKTLPLLITAFGYSIIVPSLSTYFQGKALELQKTILIGSLITLLIYVLWELVTLGNIPLSGPHGLDAIAKSHDHGTEVANALMFVTHNLHLEWALTLFALFAVITSFLGVSMALYHTLADGLQLPSHGLRGVLLLILTYLPPMLFLLSVPTGFSRILSWAGVLVSLLMGILPVAMVLKGRLKKNLQGYRVPGGLAGALLVMLFFVSVMAVEFF